MEIGNRKVVLYLIDFSRNSEKKYRQISMLVKRWLHVVSEYASDKCAAQLSIYLYLTPFKKVVGESGEHMDVMQINTASTTSCMAENTILIFRKEEWFKVFIHETFHCMGLDFSAENTDMVDKQIKDLYVGCDPSLDVRFYETYCEVWATIMNILFIMCEGGGIHPPGKMTRGGGVKMPVRHLKTRKSRDVTNLGFFVRSLDKERKYAMYQTAKVLEHYGMTYRQLVGLEPTEEKYREKTQIFAYYVLKSNILFFMCGFWDWVETVAHFSLDFPKSRGGMESFFRLIREKYQDADYIRELEGIELQKNSKKYRSMKMSVHGDFFSL